MRRISAALYISLTFFILAVSFGCSRNNSVGNTTVPKPPKNLIAQSISASAVRLSWADDSNNETGFVIYRSDNGPYREVDRVPDNVFVYSDIGLKDSATYYYYVVATNEMGNSRSSNIVAVATAHSTAAPFAPSNPSPEDEGMVRSGSIVLGWECQDPNNDPILYDLHFGTDPNPPRLISGIDYNNFSVSQLRTNTLYFWRIVALDQHHETPGPIWMFLTDTFQNQAPDTPSTPYPEDCSALIPTNITLTWSSSDADGDFLTYDIYFGTTNQPPYVASQFTTTFIPPYELEPLTIYRWQVIARDGQNETRGRVWKFTTGEGPMLLGRLRSHDPVFDVWISSDYIYATAHVEDYLVVEIAE